MKRVTVCDHEGVVVARVGYNENLVSLQNPSTESIGLSILRSGDFVLISKYRDWRWNTPSPYRLSGELISEKEAVELINSSGNLHLLKKYGLDDTRKKRKNKGLSKTLKS